MPTTQIRQSGIAAAACLRRFHAIYEEGIEDTSDDARRGTAFHDIALQRYIPRLVETGESQNLDELERAFTAGIVATKCPPHLYDEVEDLTMAWGRRFELDHRALLAVEERRAAFGASGAMDLAFAYPTGPRGSVLSIRDFKTWHAILNADAVRNELQGKLYVSIAMETWPGFDVYEFVVDHVRYGVDTVVEYTAEDLESLRRHVRARLAQIDDARARNDWPAQPGEHCSFCRLACPAVDDPRVTDRRCADKGEAEIVAGRVLATRARLSSDVAALKGWATTEGPVRVGRMEFAHRETERTRYLAADVVDACRAANVIPPRLTCGKSILRPLIATKRAQRAHPALVKTITDGAIVERATKFTARKMGDVAAVDVEADDLVDKGGLEE